MRKNWNKFLRTCFEITGDVFHSTINPDTDLQINLSRIRACKYDGLTSTTFGTGTQNVRCVDFPSSAYFSLPGK